MAAGSTFEGAFTALITPFRDGKVDEKALRDLVERQIGAGIDGLVPCGTTGESVTLDGVEHATVIRVVVEQVRGRVPVVAGAGTHNTRRTIALCHVAREMNADGVLLVCPYYNKPTQRGLEAHFRAVMADCELPAMLYNVPSRTSCDLLAETVHRLLDVPGIVAVKEASGNVLRTQQIVARCGERLSVLSGDDALTLGIMACGGRGVVSVASNLAPAEVAEMVHRMRDGDLAGARETQLRMLPLFEALFCETNPGPVKHALATAGHIAPEIRLPLVWPEEQSQQRVRAALDAAGVQV